MKKTLVAYYSRTGNNKYIAEKFSQSLECDIESIIPKSKSFFSLMISSLFKVAININDLKSDLKNYERVILIGPIWVGTLVAPLRGFIKKYKEKINDLIFITACGSDVESKDDKFGYEKVFSEAKRLFSPKNISCYAISLKELFDKSSSINNQVIFDEVFTGKIKDRFDEIISKLKE